MPSKDDPHGLKHIKAVTQITYVRLDATLITFIINMSVMVKVSHIKTE